MILFLYGEDTYRLKQKIKELKQKHITASLGDTNLAVLDGKTVTADNIIRQVLAFPFLAKSRLIIIENLLNSRKPSASPKAGETSPKGGETREKIVEFLPKIPSSSIVVFAEEGMPDKRTALFKKLNQPKISQEFKLLEPNELNRWIQKQVEERGGEIEPDAISKLVEYVGNDLWRLSNELDKLTAYSQQLTAENIELLIKPQIESNVFNLIDNIGAKNRKRALQELHQLLEAGQNELYILSMIVYQFRNLLIVRDFVERGVTNQYDIAKKASLHPFVAGKTLAQAKNYTIEELKKIYALLLDYDIAIKTGKIDSKTALDLLIVKLCGE